MRAQILGSTLAVLSAYFLDLVTADDVDTTLGAGFTYPVEEGLTLYERDTVNVSWTSPYPNATLWTFCWEGDDPDAQELVTKKIIDDVAPYNGSELVYIDFQTTADNCWFNLRLNDTIGINSVGFKLSASERSQTTLGPNGAPTTTAALPGTTPTAPPTTTADPSPTSGNSNQSSDADGDQDDGGLGTGAKAGIGVGVSMGFIGIGALVVAIWLLRRRKARTDDEAVPAEKPQFDNGAGVLPAQKPCELPPPVHAHPPVAEIDSRPAVQELPG